MYPDEIYNNGKGCKSFQQLLITGVNTWWIQTAKKTWLVWFIYPTFDCTRWAIKGRSKMWKRGTFLSWNRNHFFPSFGKAHQRSRSLNQVVWKPWVHSINWKKTRRSFKIESSGRRPQAERQATKNFGFLKAPLHSTERLHTAKCWLSTATTFGELPKALNDTSSGKVFRKTERTAQRFCHKKLNPRVGGNVSSEKMEQSRPQ